MESMKATLRRELAFLDTDAREKAIDAALRAFTTPTVFMIEAGVATLKSLPAHMTPQLQVERVFGSMIYDAKTGG